MAKLGIVLATYNEAANLPVLVESLEGLLASADFRVFVVDDNSPDGTAEVARGLAARYGNISLITRPGKLGLGSALRDGMSAALAEGCAYVLTMDADLSHNPRNVPRLLELAESGEADLVQGSRYVAGGGTVGWGWGPRLRSRVANLLCRWFLGSPRESTTNFRIYNVQSARLAVEESRARDFEFQPECVLIAMRHGLRIVEAPITFTARAEGKSKLGMAQNVRWLMFFVGALFAYRLKPRFVGRQAGRPSRLDQVDPTRRCR